MTVFDPSNFSQNVLTAARTLQQVNNGIQSLQNEAMFLINQARNLASLPYSSLAQLQQSIGQTRQLLSQAQRIAYDVSAIDQAFSQQLSAELRLLDLLAATARRRPGALAELAGGLPGRHARAGRRRRQSRSHARRDRRAWCRRASPRRARCRPRSPAISSSRSRPISSRISPP